MYVVSCQSRSAKKVIWDGMEFFPRTIGTRPRLACEVRAEGVVAARGEDASGLLAAVSRVGLPEGLAKVERAAVAGALRRALEAVSLRTREVTLVVPDTSVRVLLLDFDALPGKAAEALAVVRFRLKKLLPFDADDAAVSYQVMATSKNSIQVVAVAMPREVLAEYEGMVREAGFEPGAVLPSTLAAVAGLVEGPDPVLVVNAGHEAVTTAIVRAGVLLLHRTVDLTASDLAVGDLGAGDRNSELHGQPGGDGQTQFGAGDFAGLQTAVLAPEMIGERELGAAENEVAQAVSVAAAYFEDTLERLPEGVLAAGTLGAEALAALLEAANVRPVPVREMVDGGMLGAAVSAGGPGRVPFGWLAGVRGALAN